MDTIGRKFNLLLRNACPGNNSVDICEHLPTLFRYAMECDSVFETGVRGCVSSWAFLLGLLKGKEGSKRLLLNDISECDVAELVDVSKRFSSLQVEHKWQNNLTLTFDDDTRFDLTFIDTWHVYGQLKRELSKFSTITNKYIIMHDTTVDEIFGETIRNGWNAVEQSRQTGIPVNEINKGLWPAIEEFLQNNPEWCLKERYTNNNGLTILARKE
jgi:hypothetical protein